jgi:hypothetical protein
MLQGIYRQVYALHILTLVLCLALSIWHLVFVIRPAHSAVMAEHKRVAHLLSALPQDHDVEGMLACTLLVSSAKADDVQTQLEDAIRAREASVVLASPRPATLRGNDGDQADARALRRQSTRTSFKRSYVFGA